MSTPSSSHAVTQDLGVLERRRLSVLLLVLCQSMQSLVNGGIALFLPLLRADLGLTFSEAGALSAAASIVYALAQLPVGYLAERVGPKRLFLIGAFGTNVLTLVFSQLHSFSLLVADQALSGGFRAMLFAPGMLLITRLFPVERRATAMGIFVAGGFTSNIFLNSLGPLLVGPLGWRTLFVIFACSGCVILVLYWALGAHVPDQSAKAVSIRQTFELFRHRVIWVIGSIQYVRLAVASGFAFWLPSFIVYDRGHSLQFAGLLVALGAALTAPANFLGAYLSDRLQRPVLVIGISLTALAASLVLLANVRGTLPLIGAVAVNAVFIQFYFGPLFSVPVTLLGSRAIGVTTGFGNFFANVGGFTFAYTLGALKDATGSFTWGFYSLAALCVAGLVATMQLGRMTRVSLIAES